MGASLLNIAVSGLNAAMGNLTTTSHNIANASTPGFNRQSTIQTTQTPQLTGSGFFGQGTNISTVVRAYNQFIENQVTTATTQSSQLQTYSDQINQIQNLMSDPTTGVTPAITGFFSSVNQVAADPSSTAARQSLLTSGQSLASTFQDLSQQLTQINDGVNSQIVSETTTINSLASQIAGLNKTIAVAQAAGPGQPANDLLDQRDQLVAELNSHIAATVVTQSDGSYSVFVGNGQPLVVGQSSFTLSATPSTSDPAQTVVNLVTPTGSSSAIPENLLSGGALGGLLQFRSQTLNDTQNALGRIAIGIATDFNTQQELGQDLTGAMGSQFFSVPAPTVLGDANNPPPATGPGTVSATISDPSALTTSDYQLTAGSNGYSLMRLSDNTVVASGATLPLTVDGMTIRVSGALSPGESFKIEPTKYAAQNLSVTMTDVRSIAAGVPVTASTGIANTGTVQTTAGALVAPITLTYSSGNQAYTGFPAGTTLSIWNGPGSTPTTQTVTSQSQAISIPTGANVSVNGMTFQINGAPANGDTFTVGPNQLQAGSANVGPATIGAGGDIASTTLTYSAANNGFSITPPPSPLVGTTVSVTSGGVTTQYPINLATDTIPYVAGATYQYNGVSFSFGGAAPAGGDTFTIGASPTVATGVHTGSGAIKALPISSGAALLGNPTTFTYSGGNLTLSLPRGGQVSVTAGGATTSYPATGTVPYIAGATYSYGGVNFVLSGTPSNSDTFVVGQLPSTTSGSATITETPTTFSAALPTSAYTLSYDSQSAAGYATGASVLLPGPVTITGGNNSLSLSVDGTAVGPVTLTNTAPTETPSALAANVQTKVNAALSAAGSAAQVTASINANGQLVIASNSLGSGSSVSAISGNFATAVMGTPTLVGGAAGNILTGFPPGSTVAVTVNGTTTEVPIATPNTGVTFTSGMQLTVNGVSLTLTGAPQNGDTFIVAPTSAGTVDNRNMQLLGALQTMKTLLGGTASYVDAYSQVVSTVGNQANEVNVLNTAQQAQLTQAQNNQQSFSGVNLDEEAANLIRYQQQYQASAKVISMASKLFDTLTQL